MSWQVVRALLRLHDTQPAGRSTLETCRLISGSDELARPTGKMHGNRTCPVIDDRQPNGLSDVNGNRIGCDPEGDHFFDSPETCHGVVQLVTESPATMVTADPDGTDLSKTIFHRPGRNEPDRFIAIHEYYRQEALVEILEVLRGVASRVDLWLCCGGHRDDVPDVIRDR